MTEDKDGDKPKVISGTTVFMFLILISAIGLGPLAIWDVIKALEAWH
jgi:hypothetical protein